MIHQLIKVWQLLSAREKLNITLLLPILLFGAVLDSIGVASVMPFIAVLSNPDIAVSNQYLKAVYNFLGYTSKLDFMKLLAILFFSLYVFAIAYKAATSFIITRYALMREYSIGRRLVRAYLQQPYEWFLNRHSSDLAKSILNEVGRVVGSVIMPFLQLFVQSAVVISLLTLLFVVNRQAAITIGALLSFSYSLIYILQRSRLRRIGNNIEISNKARFRMINEAFLGIKNVKAMGLEDFYETRFSVPARMFAMNISASNISSQLPRYVIELIAFGGMIVLVFFLIDDYTSFQSTLPIIAVYALAGYKMMPSIQQIYTSVAMLKVGGPTLDRLYAEFRSLELCDNLVAGDQLGFRAELHLNSVSYKYTDSKRLILSNIDFKINPSSKIGIVGPTGSGKSTLIDIILGLLNPIEGSMILDGVPITRLNLARWRKSISYVPQQTFLVDDTIYSNIAYGVTPEDCDMQRVIEAARSSCLHEFIVSELPNGYNTIIGERGVKLSGGQIQRLGIARALYRATPLLVLDEATSALDHITEANVMNSLHNLRHKPAIVIVTHRLSTVRECDKIFVIQEGRITDSGSFDALYSRSGCFRDMILEV